MDDILIQNALAYATEHQLMLRERLGFGVHGIVFVAEDNAKGGNTAVKVQRETESYMRERDAYCRLSSAGVRKILEFHVPQLTRFDDRRLVIEMTIVERPFVLDFAGAYLDTVPSFSDEIWDHWLADKQEQFEHRWPKVREVLAALEDLDIHMIDVSPSNIAFRD